MTNETRTNDEIKAAINEMDFNDKPKAESKPKTAAKPKAKAQTKTTKAKAESKAKTVKGHVIDPVSPYSQISKRAHFSAYTLAAFKVSGALTLTAKGTPGIGKKPDAFTLRSLIGSTAANHWKKGQRIEGGALTAHGLNEVQRRLDGQGSYRTTIELVNAFEQAIKKGGKAEIEGTKYNFQFPV